MSTNGASNYQLMTIDDALKLSEEANTKNHKEYINPELVKLLKILKLNKIFIKAQDCQVWDDNGNAYVDFLGGYGSLNLGHNPREVLEAVKRVESRPNLLQVSLNPITGVLAHNLASITPGDLKMSFFGNSGAEAVEGALKLARIATGRTRIIACNGSFHGKSLGALSVTGRMKYRKPFEPLIPGVEFENSAIFED